MSKSAEFENAFLLLVFNNDNIALVGDATGLRGSSADGNLYLSLHTADPGAGNQTTSEATYTGYVREPLVRSVSGWVVTGNSVSPAYSVTFGINMAGAGTITHTAIGTSVSGAGMILFSGALTPNVILAVGLSPQIAETSTIVEE